ncbi:hypothetical protein [Streptomyces laurentii]|uniref:hypothetical protein n=1 Tax=Streptomyces laurentii TaxID=39478 RepID=UPI003683A44E
MSKRLTAVVAGAVITGVLAVGSWVGYQHFTEPTTRTEVLRGYDAYDPASTAPEAEAVFTGRVAKYEEQRDVDGVTQDIYRVDIVSLLRGNLRGAVRVTYAPEREPRPRLAAGSTYVFATRAWPDTAKDGYAQLYQGPVQPVTDTELATWKRAAALLTTPE